MKNKNLTTGIIIVAIILVITVSASYYQKISSDSNIKSNTQNAQFLSNENNTSDYRNGIYSVEGKYISPGGAEEIGVSLTLDNGIIIDSEVETRATRDVSVIMQNDFAANYKEQVIGRNIDEVVLTKVSGSSLTPNGFNDALEKIKQQARS